MKTLFQSALAITCLTASTQAMQLGEGDSCPAFPDEYKIQPQICSARKKERFGDECGDECPNSCSLSWPRGERRRDNPLAACRCNPLVYKFKNKCRGEAAEACGECVDAELGEGTCRMSWPFYDPDKSRSDDAQCRCKYPHPIEEESEDDEDEEDDEDDEGEEEGDGETGGDGDEETGGDGDEETGGDGDEETGGDGDEDTGGDGDEEAGGDGDEEAGGDGDEEDGGDGDEEAGDIDAFNMIHLTAHNQYRSLHVDTDALVFDSDLADGSQIWADHLNNCNEGIPSTAGDCPASGQLKHSDTNGYGENLAWNTNLTSVQGSWATDAWYEEITNPGYDFANPGWTPGAGHFTQVVWKSTTHVGCAINNTFVVCRYSPPGNVLSQFADNVMPLL